MLKNLDNAIYYYYYIVLVPYTYLFPKLCRGCCQRGILPVEGIIFETLRKSSFLFGINPGLNFTCLKIFEELGPAFGPGCLPFSGLRFNYWERIGLPLQTNSITLAQSALFCLFCCCCMLGLVWKDWFYAGKLSTPAHGVDSSLNQCKFRNSSLTHGVVFSHVTNDGNNINGMNSSCVFRRFWFSSAGSLEIEVN